MQDVACCRLIRVHPEVVTKELKRSCIFRDVLRPGGWLGAAPWTLLRASATDAMQFHMATVDLAAEAERGAKSSPAWARFSAWADRDAFRSTGNELQGHA